MQSALHVIEMINADTGNYEVQSSITSLNNICVIYVSCVCLCCAGSRQQA
jgi:hypothetical protein